MLFKLSKLNSNLALTLGYLNPALNARPWIAFTSARKQFRIGLLFTQKNSDFGVISVTKQSCPAPISKVECQILDRSSYYTR